MLGLAQRSVHGSEAELYFREPNRRAPASAGIGLLLGQAFLRHSRPLLCLERIVRTTAQRQVLDGCGSSIYKRHDVVIFEEPALRTAAGGANERALPSIAFPHGALDRRRNVAAARRVLCRSRSI
jgi:hypothetical protein